MLPTIFVKNIALPPPRCLSVWDTDEEHRQMPMHRGYQDIYTGSKLCGKYKFEKVRFMKFSAYLSLFSK